MIVKYTGYHGTKPDAAEVIASTGVFKYTNRCEEDWLGNGVYFFQDDQEQTKRFCSKARCWDSFVIIRCQISVEDDNLLDLVMIENYDYFEKTANTIKNKYQNKKNGDARKNINSVVIDIMINANKKRRIDVIRGAFQVPQKFPVERTNVIPTQIQICVRNVSCISKAEEVYKQ